MFTGLHSFDGQDIIAPGIRDVGFALTRTYAPEVRSLAGRTLFDGAGALGESLLLGFPWTTSFDERLLRGNVRVHSFYHGSGYKIPVQVPRLLPTGQIQYFYPRTRVEEHVPGLDMLIVGGPSEPKSHEFLFFDEAGTERYIPRLVAASRWSVSCGCSELDVPPVLTCSETTTYWESLDLPLEPTPAEIAAAITAHYFEVGPTIGQEWFLPLYATPSYSLDTQLRLQGFEYEFSHILVGDPGDEFWCGLQMGTDGRREYSIYELKYYGHDVGTTAPLPPVSAVPQDKTIVSDDGTVSRYDRDDGRLLSVRTRTGDGLEYFPPGHYPVFHEGRTYSVAAALVIGSVAPNGDVTSAADARERRLLLSVEEVSDTERVFHWALAYADSQGSHIQDQVRWISERIAATDFPFESAEWGGGFQDGWIDDEYPDSGAGSGLDLFRRVYGWRLTRVENLDAHLAIDYRYGSFLNVESTVPDDSVGLPPDPLHLTVPPHQTTIGPLDRTTIAEVLAGPIDSNDGPMIPMGRYQHFGAFFHNGSTTAQRYTFLPGVASKTWRPVFHSTDPEDPPTWELAYEYSFAGNGRTIDPNTITETPPTWFHQNQFRHSSMPPGWITYFTSVWAGSTERIEYPNIELDYLGGVQPNSAEPAYSSTANLSSSHAISFYFDAARVLGSYAGVSPERPLAPFDVLAESNWEFLKVSSPPSELVPPDPTDADNSALQAPSHRLEEKNEYSIAPLPLAGMQRLQVDSEFDAYSNKSVYEYDDDGDLVAAEHYPRREGSPSYDATPAVSVFVDRTGPYRVPTSITHVVADRVDVTSLEYEADDPTLPTAVEDNFGRRTVFEYDELGRLVGLIDADGVIRTVEYLDDNPFSRAVKSVTRGSASESSSQTVTYENEGTSAIRWLNPRAIAATSQPGDLVSSYGYDAYGRVSAIQQLDGASPSVTARTLLYSYLPGGQVDTITDIPSGTAGRSLKYRYDLFGRVTELQDQLSRAWRYYYDPLGRVAAIESPGSDGGGAQVTLYVYDKSTRRMDAFPENKPTLQDEFHVYGPPCGCSGDIDRLYQVIQCAGIEIPDPEPGQSHVDSAGTTMSTQVGTPLRRFDLYYDAVGRVALVEILEAERLETPGEEWNWTPVRTLQKYFDTVGQLTAFFDSGLDGAEGAPLGHRTFLYEYNQYFELTKETAPDGFVTTFGYDEYGRPAWTGNPLGLREHYTYDAETQRLASVESALAGMNTFNYHDGSEGVPGMLKEMVLGNGGLIDFTYDEFKRLGRIYHKRGGDSGPVSVMSLRHDTYDPTTWNREDELVTYGSGGGQNIDFQYQYTPYGELASYFTEGNTLGMDRSYVIDDAHNITEAAPYLDVPRRGYVYNEFNQLKQIDRWYESFGFGGDGTWIGESNLYYDGFGNLSSWTNIEWKGQPEMERMGYEYDSLNHLREVTTETEDGPVEVTYTVDAMARLARRASDSDNSVRRLFYNGLSPSVTLLGDAPRQTYYEDFTNEDITSTGAWESDYGSYLNTPTWSWEGGTKLKATVPTSGDGVMLAPDALAHGSSSALLSPTNGTYTPGFTIGVRMDVGNPNPELGEDPPPVVSGSGGLVFGRENQANEWRAWCYWVYNSGTMHWSLRMKLKRYSTQDLEVDEFVDVDMTAPGSTGDMRMRVRFEPDEGDYGRLYVERWHPTYGWYASGAHAARIVVDLTSSGRDSLDGPGFRTGLYAAGGTPFFDGWWVERRWHGPVPDEDMVSTASWEALGTGTLDEDPATGALAPQVLSWEAGSGAGGLLGVQWDGDTISTLGSLDPSRRVLGLVLRPQDTATTALQAIDLLCDTSVGPLTLHYDPAASEVEIHGSSITIPLKGDFANSRAARWHLVVLDPVGDLGAIVEDPRMNDGRAALGRIQRIRVLGRDLGLGKLLWWSRLPERIYTAGLGEWSLAARWNVDVDPEATTVEPYYMMRHRHLHRNGRFDVTGFSPLDGERQNAQMQQFSPYGLLVAEGEVEPDGDSTMDDVPTSTMNETARTRVLGLGLTGKQYDPETQLYYFGYRWYSPELRRWTQSEPLGLDGPNLYHSNWSDPVNWSDLTGLGAGRVAGEWHHVVVQEFFTDNPVVDMNSPEFGWILSPGDHWILHTRGYNLEWQVWLSQHEYYTLDEVMAFVTELKTNPRYSDIFDRGEQAPCRYDKWRRKRSRDAILETVEVVDGKVKLVLKKGLTALVVIGTLVQVESVAAAYVDGGMDGALREASGVNAALMLIDLADENLARYGPGVLNKAAAGGLAAAQSWFEQIRLAHDTLQY